MRFFVNYRDLKIEIALLVISCIILIASLVISYITSDYLWFGRSGSIMTLSAVIVEYRLHNAQLNKIFRRIKQAGMFKGTFNSALSQYHRHIARIAHIFVVCGTFVWGYGDLIGKIV